MGVSRQGRFASSRHSAQVSAQIAAESGVNDAVAKLNVDNSWAPLSYSVTLPNGQSAYTIEFVSPSTGDKNQSVNNLAGLTPVMGPRGADSVPASSVYLVVRGSCGEVQQRLEVIVKTAPFAALRSPLVSSDKQVFRGTVLVDGIKSFDDVTPVQADLHSNLRGNVPSAITWLSLAGESFSVNGDVSATSMAIDAININSGSGSVAVQGVKRGAGVRPFPQLDIQDTINQANGPAFAPVVGVNTLSGGDHLYGGGTVNGDLVLDGADLFVSGDFRVNGSITGTGSIYVLGDTQFSGASDVNLSEGHVALYSKGHVTLDGFDGTTFLNAVPGIARPLDNVIRSVTGLRASIASTGQIEQTGVNDYWRAILGQEVLPSDPLAAQVQADLDAQPPGGHFTLADTDSLGQITDALIASQGSSDPEIARTANFLKAKLSRLQFLSKSKTDVNPLPDSVEQPYLNEGKDVEGLLDFVIDGLTGDEVKARLAADLRMYSWDALGTSYFKGVVYTNGAFYCNNEVQIVGGAYVEQNDDSPTTTLDVGGVQFLSAGEVLMDRGSRLTYVEGLLEQGAGTANQTNVVPVYWMYSTL